MHAAQGALRQGVLYDMLEREDSTDLRSSMIDTLAQRFGVDAAQGDRVQRTAVQLFRAMHESLPSKLPYSLARLEKKLSWAANLLEIGTQISHSDFHKHGAYILDNSDLPGFSMAELHRLSQLILGHRGKLKKLDSDMRDAAFVQQLMALRLAAILCHARRDPDLRGFTLRQDIKNKNSLVILCKKTWVQQWPQSAHLLREECIAWQKSTWNLSFEENDS